MTFALTLSQVRALGPCLERWEHAKSVLPARKKITAAMAREAGCSFDDLIWLASAVARKDSAVERRVRHWIADCAARVLHIYERDYPTDMRVRRSIQAARDFADGRNDAASWDAAGAASWAASWDAAGAASWDAARAAAWDAAGAAARAASWDAAGAAAWAASWDAAGAASWDAARAAAWDAARAAARAASWDAAGAAAWAAARAAARAAAWAAAGAAARAASWDAARAAARAAAWDAEEQWQFDRLILWLSEDEPEPFPMPAIAVEKAA